MTAKLTSDLDRALSDLELRCLQLENQADDLRREVEQMRNQHSAAMAQAREAEWTARRCECGADDACAFARERDEARAEVAALKALLEDK